MSLKNALTAARVDELVRLAGGPERVVEQLGVSLKDVRSWHFEGLSDPGLAGRLMTLAETTQRPRGRPRRSSLVGLEALRETVEKLGGTVKVAEKLSLTPRSLRRYLSGQITPSRETIEALQRLSDGSTLPLLGGESFKQPDPREVRKLVPPTLTLPLFS